ncbi:MAG TPA: adenylate/guanylate cyclase domain-containing protein [Reyranella sp.]|nr:adenylate/guanylate cyclase domain-containing protein [Reyranella sp.]
MRLSRRARREWRIFLWVSLVCAVISAGFGYRVAPEGLPQLRSALSGVLTSLVVATPIFLFQLKGERAVGLRRLRRLPLALYLAIKVLFYFVVIVGGLTLARYWFWTDVPDAFFAIDAVFRRSIVFAIIMSVIGSVASEMSGLLGFATLKNLLTGRYVQPQREQRAFLLIDMKDSTGVAERLGPVRFHELLNDFFRDVAEAALECEAEIHKYVGDEAILTWRGGAALADGDCLRCPFLAQELIERRRETYLRRYDAVPQFRAAGHYGEIVAGEIGDVRREIAYVGDTLNVATRLLDAAKALGHDVLVSDDLLKQAALPAGLAADALPTLSMRGRTAPLAIAALRPA